MQNKPVKEEALAKEVGFGTESLTYRTKTKHLGGVLAGQNVKCLEC